MDLHELIPNNKDCWIVKNNILYIEYLAKIPILMKEDDMFFIFLDIRILRHVIDISKYLLDNNIDFLFRSSEFIKHRYSESDMHKKNILHLIQSISNSKIFNSFNKSEIDFLNHISNYLRKYNCYNEFKEIYDHYKSDIGSKFYDIFKDKYIYKYSPDIREYILSMEREVKIRSIF